MTQLLSNPSLMWLDEPTTGLDSTSAYQVIKTLQNLARKGRTIIVTSRSTSPTRFQARLPSISEGSLVIRAVSCHSPCVPISLCAQGTATLCRAPLYSGISARTPGL